MDVAVLLFTRDLRLHDNPALVAAVEEAETVLPLFVLDEGIGATRYGSAPNRRAFLEKSLVDLDASLRRIGGALAVRRGEVVTETARAAREVGATTVFATADVSAYARTRERRLGAELDLRLVDGSFVVPPGEVTPTGKDHYEVFTPYFRAWSDAPFGTPLPAPKAIRLPSAVREELCVDSTQAPLARALGDIGDFVLIHHKVRSPVRWAVGRRPVPSGRAPGCGAGSTDTARAGTTTSPQTRPRASRRTSTSAACQPGRLRRAPANGEERMRTRSSGSSAGATSTPSSSLRVPRRRWTTCGLAATAGSTTPTGSRPGRRG